MHAAELLSPASSSGSATGCIRVASAAGDSPLSHPSRRTVPLVLTDVAGPQTRQTVLTWMVLVFEQLDSLNELHALYAIFFHYMDYETLRPLLCNLIHRLTRRCDVRPFRISRLCELFERGGCCDLPLYGLLCQYQGMFPTSVVMPTPRTKLSAPFFKLPDPVWAEAIAAVQLSVAQPNPQGTYTTCTLYTGQPFE